MKSTGVVRKIDEMGRVVIPKEIRNVLGIYDGDILEIFVDNGDIIFRKHQRACIFCSGREDLELFNEKPVCRSCIERMKDRF